ncbi:DUF5684 domain-containing protein [Ruicaihuangia caeni]|uniref:DUF5684 domain-containing protein n=1 Tax=Ruicaihuangia caeni TaxID=3042517 RepID=UPI00338E6A1F
MPDYGIDLRLVFGWVLITLGVLIALYVWSSLALSRLFAKLGEPGWKAWVPFLNTAVLFQLGGFSWLWVLTQVFPLVNLVGLVVLAIAVHRVNGRFGKGAGHTVLALLLFPVWASVLGFGGASPTGALRAREGQATQVRIVGGFQGASMDAARSPFELRPVAPSSAASPAATATAAGHGSPTLGMLPSTAAPGMPQPSLPPRPPVQPPSRTANPWAPPASPVLPSPAQPSQSAPQVIEVPLKSPVVEQSSPFEQPSVAEQSSRTSAATAAPVPSGAPDGGLELDDEATIIVGRAAPASVDDDFDATVVVPRRSLWSLETADGTRVDLEKPVVLLGRNPTAGESSDAQTIALDDHDKTVSKTHARLELRAGRWYVVDLHSTNGVALVAEDGSEVPVEVNVPTEVTGSFRLGDFEVAIHRAR